MEKMLPTTANLLNLIHKPFALDPLLGVTKISYSKEVIENSHSASLTLTDGKANLNKVNAGDGTNDIGLWVPYGVRSAVMGYLSNSQTWIASGPFSGCNFAVGINKKTGQIFAAHIAKESAGSASEDFSKYVKNNELSIWWSHDVCDKNAVTSFASYIFFTFIRDGVNSITRLDVNVNSCGATNGTIYGVHNLNGL
jgi:hypothetical protein